MADLSQIYKRAEDAFQKRNYDYARDLFLQILTLDPDNAQARAALRTTIVKKLQEQGGPSKFKHAMMRGQFEIQLKTVKDLQKRIDLCQKFLNEDPSSVKARSILAEGLLAQEHYNGAATEAQVVLSDDQSNVPAIKTLVLADIKLNKVKEAQGILERYHSFIATDRDLDKLQRDLAAMQTMKAGFSDTKDFRSSIKNASQAEELEKRQHLIQTDEELQVVLGKLEEDFQKDPTDSKIARNIGDLIFEKKKDFTKAREWYKKAAQLAPQDSVLRDKVDDCTLRLHDIQIDAANKAGDPKTTELKVARLKFALQSYERRVHDRPTDMGLHFELGRLYYQAGPQFMDKAITEFQQSVRDPKKQSDSHLFLGMAFQKKKIFDMADKQYEQAMAGVLHQDRQMLILYQRAQCNADSGNLPRAVELAKKIMEVDIGYKDISQLMDKWQGEKK